MMEINIMKADDSRGYYVTQLHIPYEEKLFGPSAIYPSSYRGSHEPTIAAIKEWLNIRLGLTRKGVKKYSKYITIGDKETGLKVLINKIGTRYHLMGEMQAKDTILTALARVVYKSCFTKDIDAMYAYMLHHLRLPANVSYALENRAPYHWYKKGIKIEVRFNVRMIGQDTCALEISDGIWAQISVQQMNIYMNYYWNGHHKGSWKYLSPRALWRKLMGAEPTEAQLKMMIAFLEQNRTDDIVQNRALELVASLEKQYEGRLAVIWSDDKKKIDAMAVRGKIADWIITDNEYKSDIQAVSVFIYQKDNAGSARIPCQTGVLGGPICIDNMTRNSSIGDQFAARALALLNDVNTVKIVNTISRYLDKDSHFEGQTNCRISLEEFKLNWKGVDIVS